MVDAASITTGALNAGSNVLNVFFYALIALVIATPFLIVMYRLSFKIKVRLRLVNNTYDQIKDTIGKIVKDKDGIKKLVYLKKMFKKEYLPLPPTEAISLDMRGKKCVEIEIVEKGQARYIIKDTVDSQFKPFDTNDRIFLINEFKKSELRKKKTMSELILGLAPLFAIVIIIALLLAFWGDVVKPFNDMGNTMSGITAKQAEITSMLKEIIKKEQIIPSSSGGSSPPAPPE